MTPDDCKTANRRTGRSRVQPPSHTSTDTQYPVNEQIGVTRGDPPPLEGLSWFRSSGCERPGARQQSRSRLQTPGHEQVANIWNHPSEVLAKRSRRLFVSSVCDDADFDESDTAEACGARPAAALPRD